MMQRSKRLRVVEKPEYEANVRPHNLDGQDLSQKLIIVSLFFMASLPLLVLHFLRLWDRAHYQFFPFVLMGAAFLVYSRLGQLDVSSEVSTSRVPNIIFGSAWVLLAMASIVKSAWLGMVSTLLLLLGLLLSSGRKDLRKELLPVWGFLWILVPPLFSLDEKLVVSLQSLTSMLTSKSLDWLKIAHLRDGNIFEIQSGRLLVDEACSGINSLFSTLTCTIFLLIYNRANIIRSIILVIAAAGWVIAGNMVRVGTVTISQARFGFDLSTGWPHELLGIIVFIGIVTLVWSTDCFLKFLRYPAGNPDAESPEPAIEVDRRQHLIALVRSPLLSLPVALAFLVLFPVQLWHFPVDSSRTVSYVLSKSGNFIERLHKLDQKTLPARLGSWEQVSSSFTKRDASSAFGAFSRTWLYRNKDTVVHLSADYSFVGWHGLELCYHNGGWESARPLPVIRNDKNNPGEYAELRFSKESFYEYGFLLWSMISSDNHFLYPRYGKRPVLEGLVQKFKSFGKDLYGVDPAPAYQFQAFVVTPRWLSEQEEAGIKDLFFQARKILLEKGRS